MQEVVQRSIATAEPCPDAIAADPAGREPQTFAAAVARTYVEHRRQQQQPLPIIRPGAMESWDEGTLPVSSLHRSSLGNVTGSVHDESISQILGATALLNTSAGASTAAAAAAALNWMAMDRQSGASGTGPGPATAAAVAHHHHLSPAAPHAVGSLLSDIGAPRLGRASLGLGIANSCLANSGQIPSGCLSTTRGTLAATSNPGPGERFGNTVAAPAVLGLEQGSVEIHSVDELGPVEFGLPLSALPPVQLQSPQVPLLFTEYAPAGGSISSMCEGQSPPRPLSPSLPPPSPQQQQPQHLHPQHHQQHRPLLLRNTSWESAMLAHQQQQDQQQRLPHGSAQSAQFGRDFGAWKPLPAAPGAATQVAGSAMPATAMPAMVPSVQICGGGNSAAAVMAMNNFNVNTASVAVQGYATGTHSIAQTSPPSSERLIPVAAPSQTAAQLDQQQQQQQDQLSPVNPRVEDIGADGGEASALAPLLRPLSYQLAFGATALGVSGGSDAVSSPVGRPYVWVAAPGMAATAAAGDVGITHSAAANASASLFVPASMPCAPSAARAGRVSAPSGLGISDMEMVPEITVPPRATDHIRRSIECRIDSAARTRAATAASLVPGAVAADGTGQVVYLRPLNFGGTPQRGGGLGGGGSSGRRSHSGSYHTKTGHGRRMMMMAVGSGDGCQQRGPRVIEAALPGPSHPLYYNTPMAEWDEPEAIAAMTAAAQAITPAGGTATRRSAFSLRSAKRLSAGQQQQQLLSQLATSPALPARAQATADAPPGEATAAAAVTAGSSALGLMPGGPTIARSSRSSLPGLGRFPFISGALWSQSQPASALVPSCAPLSPPLPQSLQLQPQPQPQPEQRLCPMPHHHPPYTIRPLHDVQGGQQQLQQQQQPPRQRGLHQLQPHALDPGRQQVAGLTRVSWHNLFPSPLAGGGGSGGDGGGGTVFAAERPAGSTSTDGFNPSGELTKRSQPQQEQFSPLSQSSIQNQSSRSRTLPMLSPGSSPREVAAPTPSGSNNADSGGDISGAGGAIPSAVPSWTLPSGGSTLVLGSQASDATSRRSASPVTPPRLTPSLSTPPPASAEASMMASCMRPHSLGAFTNVRGTLEVERTGWRVSRHTPPLPPAATMRVLEVPELDEARGPRAGTTQGTDAGEPPSLNAILRRTKRELMAQLGQCKSAEEANRITRILMAIVPDQRVGPGASQTADIGREPPPKPPTMSMPTSTPMLMPMRAPFPTLTAIWNPLNSIWDERGEQTAERSAWAPFSVAQPSLPALQQLSRFPQSQQPKKAPKETAQQQRSQSLLSTDPASLGARMQLLRPPELQLTASGSLAGSAAAALSAPPTVTATVPTPASNDERAFLNSTRERSLANSGGTALPTAFCARNPRDSGPREIAFRALMGSVHRAADVGMEAAEGQGLRDATLSAGERAASTAEPQPTAGPSGKRRDSSTSRDEDDVLNFPTHVDNLGMKAPAATARQEHYLVGLEQTQSQEERSTLCPSGPSLGPIRTSSSLPRHTSVNADSSSRSNSDRGSGDEGGGVRSYGGASGGSASRRSCGNSETPHLTFTPRSPVGSEHSGRSGHRRAPSGLETADLDGAGDTAEGAAFGSLLPSFDVASSGCGGLQIFTSPRTGLITGAGSRAVTPGAAAATTAAAVTIGSSSGGASSLGGGFASAAAAALAQHIFVSSSSVAHSRTFSRAIGSRSGASRAGSVIAVSLGDGLASSPTSSRLAGLEAIESGSHTLSQVVAAAALAGRAAGEFNSESDRGLLLSYRRLTASTGELETLSTEGIGDSSRALPVPLSWRHVTARRLRRSSSIAATSLNSGGGPLGSSIRRAGLRVEPTVSCGGEPEAVEAGADSEVGAGSASGLNIDRAATRAMAIDSGNRAELAAGSAAGLPAAAGGSCGFPSKAPSVWCLQASRAAVAGAAGDAGNSSACSRALPHSASFDGTDTDAGVNAACTDFADEDEGDGGVTDRPSQTAVSYTERTSTFSMQSLQCMTERTSPTMCGGGGGGGDGGGAPERFSNPSSFSNMSTRTDLLETEAQGWRQRRKAAGSSSSSVAASSYSRTSATTSISASHGRTSTTSGMRRTWGTTSRASTELFMPPGDLDDGGSGGGGDGDGPGGCVWGGDDGDGVGVGGVSVLQSTRRRHSLNTGSVPREPWAPPVAFVGDGDGDGDDDNNVASSGVEMLVRGLSGAVQSSAAPAVGLPPPPSPLLLPVVRGRRSGVVMTVVAEADLEVDSPRGCDMGGVGEGG
ncbi:hypothetical protein Vretimale_2174 [Volvox reticuliferus]|nr:hypothetical protein Vretimale_2174 [Volvox reticuliferus]